MVTPTNMKQYSTPPPLPCSLTALPLAANAQEGTQYNQVDAISASSLWGVHLVDLFATWWPRLLMDKEVLRRSK